jgi:hypothetical protein
MSENGDEILTTAPEEHVANCVKAVGDYRGQKIGKWEAVSRISTAIQSANVSTDSEQRTGLCMGLGQASYFSSPKPGLRPGVESC